MILLVEKDRVHLRGELLEASARGEEYPVQMGQVLGKKIET